MDLSLIASTLATLRLSPTSRLVLLEARTLADAHVPPFPPELPALLTGVESPADVATLLRTAYPASHRIHVVDGDFVKEMSLEELGAATFANRVQVYVPPLAEGSAFESFAEIVAHLRAPDGCPWDKEQTHLSLRTHLLEESYEALAAIDAGDFAAMCEEFGDLLLQIVLQAQIASEAGRFTMTEVVKGIHDKIVRRHPHVFGNLKLEDVDGVLANWERLKEEERRKKKEGNGLLDGVPVTLPALSQAQEYQGRAARVGFDWPEIEGVLEKIAEEIEEVKGAGDEKQLAGEIGDLLFALVNLARWRKVDAESALRETNLKFKKRFGFVEQGAKKQGKSLSDISLEEMDGFWNEAKKRGV